MRLWMVRVVAFSFLCCATLAHAHQDCSLAKRSVSLIVSPDSFMYHLPDSFVVEGSETFSGDGNCLDSSAYTLDYVRGNLRLLRPEAGSLKVQYRVFPFPLKYEYSRRSVVESGSSERSTGGRDERERSGASSSGLRIGGKKTFSVSVGSEEELKLDQSLELRMDGDLSGVAVRGAVTDDAGEMTGGWTRSVQEMEEMYMEVEGESFRCRVGDYDLAIDGNRFCAFDRKLEGAIAEVSMGEIRMMAAGAVTRRRFATDLFYGIGGVQGPYRLRDSNGKPVSNIVRSSERVFLDGDLLTHGEDRDYVLDCELGTIEFSPERLITERSRVMVEFEYAVDDYRKKVYGGSIQTERIGGLAIAAQAFTEADDILTLPEGPLSDRVEERLMAVGDDTSQAWVDGGELVAPGAGDYVRVDEHYEHVGPGAGNYRVRFTEVKEGRGEYDYDRELGGYRFVGQGMGSHRALIRLNLPEGKTLYDVQLDYSPSTRLSLNYEHAQARVDRNSLSSIDGIGESRAQSLELTLTEQTVGRGELTVKGLLWAVEEGFALSPLMKEAAFGWGGYQVVGSEAGELDVEYCWPGIETSLSVGRLRSPEGESNKRQLNATINPQGFPRISLDHASCYGDGERLLREYSARSLTVSQRFHSLIPTVVLASEERKETRSRECRIGLELTRMGPISGFYERTFLLRDRSGDESDWLRAGEEARDVVRVDLASSHSRGHLTYVSRRSNLESVRTGQSMWSMDFSSEPWRERLEFYVASKLTSRRAQSRDILYRRVDDGQGDYVVDPGSGEYYEHDGGDYVREMVWTGDSASTSDIKMEIRSKARPREWMTLSSSLLSDREIEERSDVLALSVGRRLINVIDHSIEVDSRDRQNGLKVRHRLCVRREGWGERRREETRSVSGRIGRGNLGLSLTGSQFFKGWGQSGGRQNEEERLTLECTETGRFSRYRLSLSQGIEERRVRLRHHGDQDWTKLHKVFVRPLVGFQSGARLSSEVALEVCHTRAEDGLPYILSVIDPPGWGYRWSCLFNWWMNESTSSGLQYVGERRGGRLEQRVKAEVRGYF